MIYYNLVGHDHMNFAFIYFELHEKQQILAKRKKYTYTHKPSNFHYHLF